MCWSFGGDGLLVQKYLGDLAPNPINKDPQKAKNVANAKVAKTSNGALKRFFEPDMAVQKLSFYHVLEAGLQNLRLG